MTSDIATIPNLGPRSAEMLASAGIHTRQQLESLGPVAAYLAVKQADELVSLNLLWAMASGLAGLHWTDFSDHCKAQLRAEIEELECR